MKHALLSLLGLFIYSGGATVLGWCLLILREDNLTSPIQLVALALGGVVGLIASVIGFIYAWEHMRKM